MNGNRIGPLPIGDPKSLVNKMDRYLPMRARSPIFPVQRQPPNLPEQGTPLNVYVGSLFLPVHQGETTCPDPLGVPMHFSCLWPDEMAFLDFLWFREAACGLCGFKRILLDTGTYTIRYIFFFISFLEQRSVCAESRESDSDIITCLEEYAMLLSENAYDNSVLLPTGGN